MRGGGQGYEARRRYAGPSWKAAEAKPVSWRRALGRGDAGISVYGEIVGASEYQDTVYMLEFLIKRRLSGSSKNGLRALDLLDRRRCYSGCENRQRGDVLASVMAG